MGASSDEVRQTQLERIARFRAVADKEIAGVVDENYANFNTSLARFTTISNQLQGACGLLNSTLTKERRVAVPMLLFRRTETREHLQEVNKRATDGKNILSSKTKNLRELLLQKYEAQKVMQHDLRSPDSLRSSDFRMLDFCRSGH